MIMNPIDPLEVGDRAAIVIGFKSGLTGAYANPTTGWTLTVRRTHDDANAEVDDAEVVYTYGTSSELTTTATGKFLALVPCTAAGRWVFTIESEGPTLPGTKNGVYFVGRAQT